MVSFAELQSKRQSIVVVGLGYVGLPLAIALARHFKVIGFDVKENRITELQAHYDRTREVTADDLMSSTMEFVSDPVEVRKKLCGESAFIIVAVPTPVNQKNEPDLTLVEKASAMVGKDFLSPGSVVVYESTVYPGVTEDICIPILEEKSQTKRGIDFKVGYSPERINPGDHEHTINKVTKIVSGMDAESLDVIAAVYGSITTVFKASSIKVAEAAKVIENTQRDINIALMNELAVIFSKMGISTYDVLAAAGTKWNFLKFTPGLVGGHCIGVDPYYLTHRAEQLGYTPEVILSGRKINDGMGEWIVEQVVQRSKKLGKDITKCNVLVCGMTFKENVPDVRNSKVWDIIQALKKRGAQPTVYDPIAYKDEVEYEYDFKLAETEALSRGKNYDIIIVAVAHREFVNMTSEAWQKIASSNQPMVVDVKGVLNKAELERVGFSYWTL